MFPSRPSGTFMHGSAAFPPSVVPSGHLAAWPRSLAPSGWPYVLNAHGTGPSHAAPTPDQPAGLAVDPQLSAQQHVAAQLLSAVNAQHMAAPEQPHLTHEAAQVAQGRAVSEIGGDGLYSRHSTGHHHHGSEQLQLNSVPAQGSAAATAAEASGGPTAAAETAPIGPGSKQGNRRSQLDTMSQVLLSEGSAEGQSGDLRPTAQSSMTTSTGGSTGAGGHTHSRPGGGGSSCAAGPSQPSSIGAPAWDAGEALLARLVAERGSNAVQALAQLGCAHPTPAAEAGARAAAAAAAAVSGQLNSDGSGEANSGGSEGGAGPRGSWGTGRPSVSTASRGSMGPPLPRAPPLTLPPAKVQHTASSHSPAAAAASAAALATGHTHARPSAHAHAPSTPRLLPLGPASTRSRLGEPTFTLVRSLLVAQQEAFLGQLYDLHRAATRQRRLAAELAATPAPTSAAVLAQAAIARLRAAPSSSRGTSSKKHSGSGAAPGSSGHPAGRAAGWHATTAAAAAAAVARQGSSRGTGSVHSAGRPPVAPPAGPLRVDTDDGGAGLAVSHLGHHVLLMAQLPAGLRASVVLRPGDPGPDWVGVAIKRSTPGVIRPTPARYVLRTAGGPAASAEPTVQVPSNSLTNGGAASVGGGAPGAAAAAEPAGVADTAASSRRQGGSPAAGLIQEACTAPSSAQQQQVTPVQQRAGVQEEAQLWAATGVAVDVAPAIAPAAAPVACVAGHDVGGVGRPQVLVTSPSGADGGSRHADLQACSHPLSWVGGTARGLPFGSLPKEAPAWEQHGQHKQQQQQQLSPAGATMPTPLSPRPASLAAHGAALLPGGSAGGMGLGLGQTGPPALNLFRPAPQFPPAEATRFLAGPVIHGAGFDPHSYWMKKHYGGAGPALSTPAPATAPGASGGMAGTSRPAEAASAPAVAAGEGGGCSASQSQGAPVAWWHDANATFGELGCVDPTAPIPVASQLEAGGGGAACISSLAGPPPGAPVRSSGGMRSASHLSGQPSSRKRGRSHAAAPGAEGCGQNLGREPPGPWDTPPMDLRVHNESAFKPLARRAGGTGRDRTKSASARYSAGGGSRMESVGSEEEPGAHNSRDWRPGGRSGVAQGGASSSHARSHHRPPAASRSFRSGPSQTQGSARMSCAGGGAADRNAAGILMSLSSGGALTSSS